MIFGVVGNIKLIEKITKKGEVIYYSYLGKTYYCLIIVSGQDEISVIVEPEKARKIKKGDLLLIEDGKKNYKIANYYYRKAEKIYRYNSTKEEIL